MFVLVKPRLRQSGNNAVSYTHLDVYKRQLQHTLQSSSFVFQKKLKSCLYVCSGGFGVFSAVNIYQENEKFYKKFLLPLVHHLDPELAHNIAVKVCKYGLIAESRFKDPPSLVIIQFFQVCFFNVSMYFKQKSSYWFACVFSFILFIYT